MAIPEMPPGGLSLSKRPGGLPPLTGVDVAPRSDSDDGATPKVDPLVAAVDRRAGAAAQLAPAAPAFRMTWRKGLGQPPRPAAMGGSEDPPKAADWEKSGTESGTGRTAPDGAGATGPGATGPGATGPGATGTGATGPKAPAEAVRAAGSAVALSAQGPAKATEAGSAAPAAPAESPGIAAVPAAAARTGSSPEPDRMAPPAGTGRDKVEGLAAGGVQVAATGAARPEPSLRGRPGERSAHAGAGDAVPGAAGRRRSRRNLGLQREREAAALAEAADDPAGAELRSYAERRSGGTRRRTLLLAGIGVALVAAAIAVLAVMDSVTAPPEIDYVALDAQRRAEEQTAAAGPAPAPGATPDTAAPGDRAAAGAGTPAGSPRAEADAAPAASDTGSVPPGAADAVPGIEELRQASDGGSAQAAYELGLRLLDGIGVRRDPMAATVQFQRAADQGYAPAQFALGVAYQQGEGVPLDLEQAAYWYAVAADQGNADAQFNFGTLYARGEGVEQDYYQAAKWYRRAADSGLSDAQFNYANMLESGLGVSRDREAAYRYYAMAAQAGDPVAAERERALATELGPGTVARLRAAPTGPAGAPDDTAAERGTTAGTTQPGDPTGAMARATMPSDADGAARGTVADTAGAPDPGATDGTAPAAPGRPAAEADAGTGQTEAGPADPQPLAGTAEVAELQGLLNGLGFEAGPADGVMGSRTRTAIAAFQEAAGLPADGVASRSLLLELRQIAGTKP
ncbi:MAG: peptidoglycan-binding protein [Sneathiellaceae bacterium]